MGRNIRVRHPRRWGTVPARGAWGVGGGRGERGGCCSEDDSAPTLAELAQDTARVASRPVLWPLMIGAWKRKGLAVIGAPRPERRPE